MKKNTNNNVISNSTNDSQNTIDTDKTMVIPPEMKKELDALFDEQNKKINKSSK